MTLIAPSIAPPAPKEKIHLAFLDGLRGLAAIYVMFHHSWLTIWSDPDKYPHGITGALTRWLAFGHMAVSVFIVLSGFCLMIPVVRAGGELRGGALRFFKRRAHRIIPPYYFAILLSVALSIFLIGGPSAGFWSIALPHGKHDWIKALGTHVLLIEDFFDSKKINYVFWSVAVEWQIYFLFPMLVLFWRKLGAVRTTAAALTLSYAIAIALNSHERFRQVHFNYVGLFTLGMLGAALAFGNRPPNRNLLRVIGAIAAAGVLAICFAGINPFNQLMLLVDFLVGVATLCCLVAASQSSSDPLGRFLSIRPLVLVGTFSYSLYLIHAPLLELIWRYLLLPLHLASTPTFVLLAFVGCPLIVVAAYLFFLACERPFLNQRDKKLA